jgi:FixJ family two-component response regulator
LNQHSTIAIIDDAASVRRAVDSLLRSLGFAVVSFASAEEFLAAPASNEVACVVTDVEMPGMSGIELYELLRARQSTVPIIFITANSEQKVKQRLGKDTCVLCKPFEVTDLANCIQQAI